MIVKITFFNPDVKKRFIEWVAEGNSRSVNSFGGAGIRGSYRFLKPFEALFFWETNYPFGDNLLLRLALRLNFRKRWKEIKVSRVGKEELARLVINGTDGNT